MDGRTDRPSYRDARTHLKMIRGGGGDIGGESGGGGGGCEPSSIHAFQINFRPHVRERLKKRSHRKI